MKFNIKQQQLLIPLQVIIGLESKIDQQGTLVTFDFYKSSLKLIGSNPENYFSKEIETDDSDRQRFSIAARRLYQFCSSLANELIQFELSFNRENQPRQITAEALGYKISIPTKTELIYDSEHEFEPTISINAGRLRSFIDKLEFCVLDQKLRHNLAGIYLNYYANRWFMVATDGYRISVIDSGLEGDNGVEKLLIPIRAVHETIKILTEVDADAQVNLQLAAKFISLQVEKSYFKMALLVDEYPDVTKFFELTNPNKLVLDTDQILPALRIFKNSRDLSDGRLSIRIEKNSLVLKLAGPNGSLVKRLTAKCEQYESELSVNINYLYDAIYSLAAGGEIVFELAGNNSPIKIYSPQIDYYHHIVMPLKSN